MDFDLNESFNQQFPNGFNGFFENDIFQNNVENEKPFEDGDERVSPNNPTNLSDEDGHDARGDSDDLVQSPSHSENVELCGDEYEELDPDDVDINAKLIVALESKFAVGSKIPSLDQAYLLYVAYGKEMGFSIKRASQKYSTKSGILRVKEYQCSCEGKTNSNKTRDRLANYKKQEHRCGCKAKIRLIRDSEQKWMVSIFNKEHNHELADKEHSYLLRSCRSISFAQQATLEAMYSVGIRIKDAFRFMEKESGGPGNTGFIRKDAYHHMEKVKRKSKLIDADSNSIVQHFIDRSNKEPFFYWNIQTDQEGRLMNFFFRDSRCLVDYELFGDILSVDTTYKTNKYDLICAPFVGVNHHMKNCLYGLAFLSDETTETFEWLFSTFLESMNGKEPEVVFSDQCQAMMKAIDSQFKRSSHRLCQWHINQNAPSYFGSLNGNKEFKKTWFYCMNGCETIEEFESTWARMIQEYDLVDNSWFRNMYKIRIRWASVFSKAKFCAGLHATSRSENTNKVLKEVSSKGGRSCSLYQMVMNYEQIQIDWRRTEGEDDTSCLGTPGLLVENNPLLKHASKFFTRAVFLSYEFEATHSLNVDIISENGGESEANEIEYVVTCSDDPTRTRRVTYNNLTSVAVCTCCLWQTCGVICAHIFRIFYHHKVKVIPPNYLRMRLSREAKRRRFTDPLTGVESSTKVAIEGEDWSFNSHVMRTTYEIIHDITLDSKMKAHILKCVDTLRDDIYSMAETSKGKTEPKRKATDTYKNTREKPICHDPPLPPKRRHTNTRISRHWENTKRKGKKRPNPDLGEGSRNNIPNPRMQRMSSPREQDASRASSPASSNFSLPMGHDFNYFTPHGFTYPRGPVDFYATQ